MSLSHGGYHRSFYFRFELQTALQFWTLRPRRLSRNDQAVGCATTKWLKVASLHLQFVALEQGFLCKLPFEGLQSRTSANLGFTKPDFSKFGVLPQFSAESCVAPQFSADNFLYAEKAAWTNLGFADQVLATSREIFFIKRLGCAIRVIVRSQNLHLRYQCKGTVCDKRKDV